MALPTSYIGGLISGMDTNNIITQLMSIEKAHVTKLEKKKEELNLQLTAYQSVNSLLLQYSTSATSLADKATWKTKKTASSNEAILSAKALDTAVADTYTFKVASLATNSKFMSKGVASMENAILPNGTGTRQVETEYTQDTLLEDFNGGVGVPLPLGTITISNDDTAQTKDLDLSSCKTLMDVYTKIAASAKTIGIDNLGLETANGLGFSVGTGSHFSIADKGADTTATNLNLTGLTRDDAHDFGYTKTGYTFYGWNPGAKPKIDEPIPGTLIIENAKGQAVRDTEVKSLNGGNGIYHGSVRMTNAAGTSTVVDLSTCETMNDIIKTINTTDGVGITASLGDNGLILADASGGAGSISVQNVGSGTTATDLGLTALTNNGDGTWSGSDINQLNTGTTLAMLRDGKGVNDGTAGNLVINKDGKDYTVSLTAASNLGDVIGAIKNAKDASGNLIAGITARIENNRLVVEATDASAFTIKSETLSTGENTTAEDLGLVTGTTAYTKVSGQKLVGDLNSVQISSLMGQKAFDRDTALSTYGVLAGETVTVTDKKGNAVTFTAAADSTIGDFMDAINSSEDAADVAIFQEPDRGDFAIGDLTEMLSGDLTVTGTAAAKLGFDATHDTASGTITGLRGAAIFQSGINGVRDNFTRDAAGNFTANLGTMTVNAGGTDYTFDLTTLQGDDSMNDMLETLNAQATANGLNLNFKLNNAKNGIMVVNNTGAAVSFTSASGTAAADLGFAGKTYAAGASVNAGDLDTEWITRSTTLKSLNGGANFSGGSISVTNSAGASTTIDLASASTLGDVLDAINSASCGVSATLNDSGDGIRLTDDSGGEGNITVSEVSGGSTAKMLGLLGSSKGELDGSFEKVIEVDENDSLKDVMNKVAYSGLDVQCSIINDGSDFSPYRLVITSRSSGKTGDMMLDTDIEALDFSKTTDGRDAVLLYGQGSSSASPVLMTSATNTNSAAVLGLTLNLNKASDEWVTMTVSQDTEAPTKAINDLVTAYNTIMQLVNEFDNYDSETGQAGLFFADSNIRSMVDTLSDTFFFTTDNKSSGLSSWYDLGIKFNDEGQLEVDSTALEDIFANKYDLAMALMVDSVNVARKDFNSSVSTTDKGKYPANNAINGNHDQKEFDENNGFESSNAIGQAGYDYIVNFDKIRTIESLNLYHVNSSTMPVGTFGLKDFTVSYLDANTNKWTDLRTISSNKSATNYIGFENPTAVRAVKVHAASSNATDGKFRITEIEANEPQGLGARQETALNSLTDSVSGWLATINESIQGQIDEIDEDIDKQNQRLEDVELRYIRQYTNMESTMADLTAQSNYFQQQAASWTSK